MISGVRVNSCVYNFYTAQNLESEDSELIMYIMMRAADQFYSEMSRYPGSDLHSLEADIPKLKVP